MRHYVGIDLHGNNNVLVVMDERERIWLERRLPNDLREVLSVLEEYRDGIDSIGVESTFNWYWLVDGLQGAGYRVQLVNTTAAQQYSGLKHRNDRSDARWIARMLRLGILPRGYICPPAQRAVRDLLRRRHHLVRHHTSHLLSVQNIYRRTLSRSMGPQELKRLSLEQVQRDCGQTSVALSVWSSLEVMKELRRQMGLLEEVVESRVGEKVPYRGLRTIPGAGPILAATIYLETGEIERFKKVGQYASYARCVKSEYWSNGKKKGEGNRKNGNKYLGWAYREAACFLKRYDAKASRYYASKRARSHPRVAWAALTHKLCRAGYFVLRDQAEFSSLRIFG